MSRHKFGRLVLGFDRPTHSFFAQYDTGKVDEDDNEIVYEKNIPINNRKVVEQYKELIRWCQNHWSISEVTAQSVFAALMQEMHGGADTNRVVDWSKGIPF